MGIPREIHMRSKASASAFAYQKKRPTMSDVKVVQLSAHSKNIERYRRLLKTNLSDVEREFVERRLKEELAAAEFLSARTSHHSPAGSKQFNART
jgi:hypothetical protein